LGTIHQVRDIAAPREELRIKCAERLKVFDFEQVNNVRIAADDDLGNTAHVFLSFCL
jgi:hypothetical protein